MGLEEQSSNHLAPSVAQRDPVRFSALADRALCVEVDSGAVLRPPLLSSWESERVRDFRSAARRDRWLAGRSLSKALVARAYEMRGIIDIRDGQHGEPMIFRDGLPVSDIWLSVSWQQPRLAAVAAPFPIGLDVKRLDGALYAVAERCVTPRERIVLERVFSEPRAALAAAWAIKEAAQRSLRLTDQPLSSVRIGADLELELAGRTLYPLMMHLTGQGVLAVVGAGLEAAPRTKVIAPRGEIADLLARSVQDHSGGRAEGPIQRSRWLTRWFGAER